MLLCSFFLFDAMVCLAGSIRVIAIAESTPERWMAIGLLVLAGLGTTCGIFILRGANWARLLFFATGLPMVCLSTTVLSSSGIVFRVIIVLTGALSLITQSSNRFFTGRDTLFRRTKHQQPDDESFSDLDSDARQPKRRGRYDY